MPGLNLLAIELMPAERQELEQLVKRDTVGQQIALRAGSHHQIKVLAYDVSFHRGLVLEAFNMDTFGCFHLTR